MEATHVSNYRWMYKEEVVYILYLKYMYIYVSVCTHTIYTMEYYSSIKKNKNFVIFDNVNGPRSSIAKWN